MFRHRCGLRYLVAVWEVLPGFPFHHGSSRQKGRLPKSPSRYGPRIMPSIASLERSFRPKISKIIFLRASASIDDNTRSMFSLRRAAGTEQWQHSYRREKKSLIHDSLCLGLLVAPSKAASLDGSDRLPQPLQKIRVLQGRMLMPTSTRQTAAVNDYHLACARTFGGVGGEGG